ncbi:MAG TPA: hypothetical protein P5555_08055 [Candidatus Paceibacterota bacterium]|nr:hypothetical protein [Verrucomicrobiota bacterium]HOX02374.1 hypothetical protein [Verrucomicrobiota bacterium]HRZ45128.1 hypothetical protein [Candidatus Paceibacterota bacterium]
MSVRTSRPFALGLFGARATSEPPDPDYPYGHRKYETIATLDISGLRLLPVGEYCRMYSSA